MQQGDQAFRRGETRGRWPEMTYGGALSFLRRSYSRDLAGVDVVVSGVPFDASVTNRPGCRFGPAAIRAASTQLAELKAFPFGFDPFETLSVIDWGDCMIDPHHPMSVAPAIEAHADAILASGARMLTLGGDHSISYPLLKAHAKKYGPIALLQFDAHCDTWEDDGKRLDHGTMFARAAAEGVIDVSRSTQLGLRTFNDHDHGFEILTAPWLHRNGIDAALDLLRDRAGDAPVYLSFDIDGLDPAFAPGTGTPVAGGLASWQALELVRGLGELNLVGMDVVEVSPPYDHAEITAIAAATVAHDWLCLLAREAGAAPREVGRL
ncbi:agmatinase [Limimaricola soesokkakensis]|uniref:Agmatinase n=1 Tax=Limimaricola soesokkakensis TaxID=1343159 RepID=A0A1X6ZCC7_9RHOB|nr:agmatinase [Limimaricola soesokkakensis]PSK86379.1 agmatinase [Limimaricola soesokkakensis]SLN46909.1 Agmatinase [Limimaricola soesokkakensis]